MLTIEEIKAKLKDRRVSVVAASIGVSTMAIYNIINGKTMPSYDTLVKLSNYLEQ